MFFPYLRGKQYELRALRDLASRIVNEGGVFPIIEPVRVNATQSALDHLAQVNAEFGLVVNPQFGDFANGRADLSAIFEELEDYESVVPTMLVNEATTANSLTSFFDSYTQPDLSIVFLGEPTNQQLLSALSETGRIRYFVFLLSGTSQSFRAAFPDDRKVLLEDCFRRRERNADYPDEEYFSDLNTQTDVAGFGDYSIAGSDWNDGGGPAHAVALHHVYFRGGGNSPVRIRHFISDRTENPEDVAGKFAEALRKLVDALPGLSHLNPRNHTPSCEEYMTIFAAERFHGLGYAKKIALKHHMELFLGS